MTDVVWRTLSRLLQPKPVPFGQPASILVIKPCCLGDVLFSTASVRALRRAFPETRIGFLVGSHSRAVVENNPDIDELIDCPDELTFKRGNLPAYVGLVRKLRPQKWDAAVVLERSFRYALLPLFAGIPIRAGINSYGRGLGLTHPAPWDETKHEIDVYLDVVAAAGVDITSTLPTYTASPGDVEWAAKALAGVRPDARIAVMHPGGGVNPGTVLKAKRWPAERYADAARALTKDGWAVVTVGSPDERELSEVVADAVHDVGGTAINLSGQTTFGQLGALAERCSLWIGNDSGPTHLAAAAGAPTIGIFGPSSPAMYAPRGMHARALWNPPHCSPCFLHGRFNEACKDWICIRAVQVDDVIRAAKDLGSISVDPEQDIRPPADR